MKEEESPPCSHSPECPTLLTPPWQSPPQTHLLGRGVDSGGGAGAGAGGSSGDSWVHKNKNREGPDQLWQSNVLQPGWSGSATPH